MVALGGSYVLVMRLDRDCVIRVGALGDVRFPAGMYAYVGSAMAGLDARIARHLRDDKRLHWHVDYLLQHAEVREVVRVESDERLECRIATALAGRLAGVEGFGCSDCGCESHLLGPASEGALSEAIARAIDAIRQA